MAHGKLVFDVPGSCPDAFEAFFNHAVRLTWDTLLDVNYIEGGAGMLFRRETRRRFAAMARYLGKQQPILVLTAIPRAEILKP